MCLKDETDAASHHCCSLHPSLIFDAVVVVAVVACLSLVAVVVVEVVDEILLLWTEAVLS